MSNTIEKELVIDFNNLCIMKYSTNYIYVGATVLGEVEIGVSKEVALKISPEELKHLFNSRLVDTLDRNRALIDNQILVKGLSQSSLVNVKATTFESDTLVYDVFNFIP